MNVCPLRCNDDALMMMMMMMMMIMMKMMQTMLSQLLPPAAVISEHLIRRVFLVPIKAYSAGLCMSKRIEPEYIAYVVRHHHPAPHHLFFISGSTSDS